LRYKLKPSTESINNTIFAFKEAILKKFIDYQDIGIISNRCNVRGDRKLHEDFSQEISALKENFNEKIPYEKLEWYLEIYHVTNPFTDKQVKMKKQNSFNTFITIILPANYSHTGQDIVLLRYSYKALSNILIDNPALEFKNTESLSNIFKNHLFYGELEGFYFENPTNLEYTFYNKKDTKKEVKTYFKTIPQHITPSVLSEWFVEE